MKETKFRAIIPEHNCTRYFTLLDLVNPLFSMREIVIPWLKAGNKPDEFTGLKDKNGVEIYEGDRVLFKKGDWCDACGSDGDTDITRTIEIEDYGWEPFVSDGYDGVIMYRPECCEVIGNIYENPELPEG